MEYGTFVPFAPAPRPMTKRATPAPIRDTVLAGFATRYNHAHAHRGRIEVFTPGCFASSLRKATDVGFLADHSWSQCYGTLASGNLQLHESDRGLAFALRPADDEDGRHLVASVRAGTMQMSVGYTVLAEACREVEGEQVRFIERADLLEVSVVERPAVKTSSITATSSATFGTLAESVRSGRIDFHHAAGRVENQLSQLRRLIEAA